MAQSQHGFAVFGKMKYPPNFTHFDYVNPNAPKKGSLRQMALGTFDSLNPFIDKGTAANSVLLIYDTLLRSSQEEAGVAYAHLAESLETSPKQIIFNLRKNATWHDKKPISPEDVKWSFETLIEKGSPVYKSRLRDIEDITVNGNQVIFELKNDGNREMPLVIGGMPILPKHYWEKNDFTAANLKIPLGSSAYKIKSVSAGTNVTFERVSDYWGRDIATEKGLNNFDEIAYDYYRDQAIAFEAFKAGAYDIRHENTAKFWKTGYDIPAIRDGAIIKKEFPHGRVSNFQAIYLNLRNPLFEDIRTRRALNFSWNFEWINKNITYGSYLRQQSYFANHVLSSEGSGASSEELVILSEYDNLPEGILSGEVFTLPVSPADRHNRDNLILASEMLKEAGWQLRDGKILYHAGLDREFRFTILLHSDSFTPHIQPWVADLRRLGIDLRIRIVDRSQYIKRVLQFEYDATIAAFAQTDIPGNEQRELWGSEAADQPYSNNIAGIKNPTIDSLIERITRASSYDELIILTRSLDRVLLWNWYMILMLTNDRDRVAYASSLCQPLRPLPYSGVQFDSWWEC